MYILEKLKLIFLARETDNYELRREGFGSVSYLMPAKDHILIIPDNINSFKLRPDDIVVVDRTGNEIENLKNHKITDYLDLHLISYDVRDDSVDVVMHINPTNATVRADEGHRIVFLSDCINPSDSETGNIAQLIKEPVAHRDYMLIKNNGVLVLGNGIFETLDKAKYIEEIAKIKMPKEEPDIELFKKISTEKINS